MTNVDAAGDAGSVKPWLDPARVPAFHLDLRTGEVAWTDANARLYGYAPGEVTPDLELVYAHRHPDDRSRLRRLVRRALDDAEGFVLVHRMITRDGLARPVVSVVDVVADDRTVLHLTGVNQGLDDSVVPGRAAVPPTDTEAVIASLVQEIGQLREGLVHRDEIGMAKGIIMAAEKVTGEEAFRRLVRASQHTNTKLRDVARLVVETGLVPEDAQARRSNEP